MPTTDDLELTAVFPVPPAVIYHAWLSGERHTDMTGGVASSAPEVGGAFTAWDDYIHGIHLELAPPHRIVQGWRTSDFEDGQPDSRLEILFDAEGGGTRVTLRHTHIPAGDGPRYAQGWQEFYFQPMAEFFAG